MDLLPPELIGHIIEMVDYQTLKSLALTNKTCLAEVNAFLNRLVLRVHKQFSQATSIEKHELIERIYYLNDYKTNTLANIGISDDGAIWFKGKNCIRYTGYWKKWLHDNKFHRTDGPAYTFGLIHTREKWYYNGIIHRTDGPAITYMLNGQKTMETYVHDGKVHCTNGPAIISWDTNGTILEEWYNNDRQHRTNGPAITRWAHEQKIEKWYQNGKYHRIDGPASITWINGQPTSKKWYRNGHKFTPRR